MIFVGRAAAFARSFAAFPPVRYIARHPFSVLALGNIVGDMGYLGFAFYAEGWVSGPKLGGALFTMLAHIILLAHGDRQAEAVAHESGVLARAVLRLRAASAWMVGQIPLGLQRWIKAKPVGVAFGMLTVNGVGLAVDAGLQLGDQPIPAMAVQALLGVLIVLGCGCFSLADFVKGQGLADLATRSASLLLMGATVAVVLLALATMNPFVVLSVLAFGTSNFAAFFARVDKKRYQEAVL